MEFIGRQYRHLSTENHDWVLENGYIYAICHISTI